MIVKMKAVNKKSLPKDKGLKKAISDWSKKNGNILAGMALVIGGIAVTGGLLGTAIVLNEKQNKAAVEKTIEEFKSISNFYNMTDEEAEKILNDILKSYEQSKQQGTRKPQNLTPTTKAQTKNQSEDTIKQKPKSK